jgi:hypothetical protein
MATALGSSSSSAPSAALHIAQPAAQQYALPIMARYVGPPVLAASSSAPPSSSAILQTLQAGLYDSADVVVGQAQPHGLGATVPVAVVTPLPHSCSALAATLEHRASTGTPGDASTAVVVPYAPSSLYVKNLPRGEKQAASGTRVVGVLTCPH